MQQFHHLPDAARHLLCIELIRLLFVACEMLSHSSSMAAGYWWELEQFDPEHPKHAQLVTMQAMEELGHFQLHRNYVRILPTWGRALSC